MALPWGEKLFINTVKSDLGHWDSYEAEAHEDGTENTDKERLVVTPANTLVEPLAVVVKDMDTLIADGTVFGSGCGYGDVAEVAPTIFYNMVMLAFV